MQIEEQLEKIEKQLKALSRQRDFCCVEQYGGKAHEDEIGLLELCNVLWKGKWMIIGITMIFAVVSVVYALSLPNIYKSEALLAPAEENAGGGLAGMVGGLGGLASLAGMNVSGGSNKITLAIEVMTSRQFITRFIDRHDLLVDLMAVKGWDRGADKLLVDESLYDEKKNKWVREPKSPHGIEPSLQEAYEAFLKLFNVSEDKETNLVTISVEYFSPAIAKEWVELLVRDINEEIKRRDVAEAEKSIEYLSEQLQKISIADMQTVFYELIEEQTKTIMFAEVRDEYIFKTVDKAFVPEERLRPKKALICVLGGVLGVILSVGFVLVRHFIVKSNDHE